MHISSIRYCFFCLCCRRIHGCWMWWWWWWWCLEHCINDFTLMMMRRRIGSNEWFEWDDEWKSFNPVPRTKSWSFWTFLLYRNTFNLSKFGQIWTFNLKVTWTIWTIWTKFGQNLDNNVQIVQMVQVTLGLNVQICQNLDKFGQKCPNSCSSYPVNTASCKTTNVATRNDPGCKIRRLHLFL